MPVRESLEIAAPKITVEALDELYSTNFAVIAEASYAERIYKALSGCASVLVLMQEGILTTRSEAKKAVFSSLRVMHGYPVGLKLIVSKNRNNKYMNNIFDYCLKQDLLEEPEYISGFGLWDWKLERKLLSFISQNYSCLFREKAELQQTFAMLRLEYEHTLRKLDKAERVTSGLAYKGFSMIYEASYGDQSIGPGGDMSLHKLEQHLPADIASLYALELYVVNIPENNIELKFTVRRIADGMDVCSFVISTSDLVLGWNLFELPYVSDDLVGEAILELNWEKTNSKSILFALSDKKAVRFGLQTDEKQADSLQDTLALRLWQGNTVKKANETLPVSISNENYYSSDEIEPVLLNANLNMLKAPFSNGYTMQAYKFLELAPRIEFLHGEEKHKRIFYDLDFWPLMLNEDLGYMQTHPLMDELSGAVLYRGAPEGTRNVRAQVRTAHAGAPKLLYILARLPVAKGASFDLDVERIKQALKTANNVDKTFRANGFDKETGILWSSLALPADTPGLICLDIDQDKIEGGGDLLFATMPVEESVACGWCRWFSLYVDSDVKNIVPIKSTNLTIDATHAN